MKSKKLKKSLIVLTSSVLLSGALVPCAQVLALVTEQEKQELRAKVGQEVVNLSGKSCRVFDHRTHTSEDDPGYAITPGEKFTIEEIDERRGIAGVFNDVGWYGFITLENLRDLMREPVSEEMLSVAKDYEGSKFRVTTDSPFVTYKDSDFATIESKIPLKKGQFFLVDQVTSKYVILVDEDGENCAYIPTHDFCKLCFGNGTPLVVEVTEEEKSFPAPTRRHEVSEDSYETLNEIFWRKTNYNLPSLKVHNQTVLGCTSGFKLDLEKVKDDFGVNGKLNENARTRYSAIMQRMFPSVNVICNNAKIPASVYIFGLPDGVPSMRVPYFGKNAHQQGRTVTYSPSSFYYNRFSCLTPEDQQRVLCLLQEYNQIFDGERDALFDARPGLTTRVRREIRANPQATEYECIEKVLARDGLDGSELLPWSSQLVSNFSKTSDGLENDTNCKTRLLTVMNASLPIVSAHNTAKSGQEMNLNPCAQIYYQLSERASAIAADKFAGKTMMAPERRNGAEQFLALRGANNSQIPVNQANLETVTDQYGERLLQDYSEEFTRLETIFDAASGVFSSEEMQSLVYGYSKKFNICSLCGVLGISCNEKVKKIFTDEENLDQDPLYSQSKIDMQEFAAGRKEFTLTELYSSSIAEGLFFALLFQETKFGTSLKPIDLTLMDGNYKPGVREKLDKEIQALVVFLNMMGEGLLTPVSKEQQEQRLNEQRSEQERRLREEQARRALLQAHHQDAAQVRAGFGVRLQRFKDDQNTMMLGRTKWDIAKTELRFGRKQSDWQWGLFPPIKGRMEGGNICNAHRKLEIQNTEEARAFLRDPNLRDRLIEAIILLINSRKHVQTIFRNSNDVFMFHSSLTWIYEISGQIGQTEVRQLSEAALGCFFGGSFDGITGEIIRFI